MTADKLKEILTKIKNVKICMIGDICLDAYFHADMSLSALSRETPHYPLPVTKEVYSLGGGGNVLANLDSLGVGKVIPVSIISDDWRGMLVSKCLEDINADISGIIIDNSRVTPCYCKPMRHGISDTVYEDPRIDFENRQPVCKETETRILEALKTAAEKADIIAVCDQNEFGVINPSVISKLGEIGKNKPVVVDSRDRIGLFENVIVKPNEREASKALNMNENEPEKMAVELNAKNSAPAIITIGEKGSVWCEGGKAVRVPAVKTNGPIDIVGAGDTFLAAFCAAYGAGIDGLTALEFANLASSVTIRKTGTTGTASPDEIIKAFGFVKPGEYK